MAVSFTFKVMDGSICVCVYIYTYIFLYNSMVLAFFFYSCVCVPCIIVLKTTRKIFISFLKHEFSVSSVITKCLSLRWLMKGCYLIQRIHLHPGLMCQKACVL